MSRLRRLVAALALLRGAAHAHEPFSEAELERLLGMFRRSRSAQTPAG